MNHNEFAGKYNLPKWPQMLVWGTPVSIEQAQDVIFRTDKFLHRLSDIYGGNNQKYNEAVHRELGYDRVKKAFKGLQQKHGVHSNWSVDYELEQWAEELIEEALGVVYTVYVKNDWTSCAFIYGGHGWLHPDGNIGYFDNIGKYPTYEEVFNDWSKIAAAFPYLDLKVTLMSGESCEPSKPVFTLVMSNGQLVTAAETMMPTRDSVIEYLAWQRSDDRYMVEAVSNRSSENKLPWSWVQVLGKKLHPVVDQIIRNAEVKLLLILQEREERAQAFSQPQQNEE
ncbi:hypothetical protein [Achromobacter phage Motura]|uniref:Uncharacterized protein n=1 Tax=Achromobacter phage Motura TaxID=2591403 RepID=A0A514CSV7_9CAUD|nr:hypothetical protein H1O15_gp219 [Achromobacter phage Motura]QDH83569.1 hypothetical protein [Achromobacter phage Motura]